MPRSRSDEVLAKHTIFECEEFERRKFRTFSAKGGGPADLHWPEHTLKPTSGSASGGRPTRRRSRSKTGTST